MKILRRSYFLIVFPYFLFLLGCSTSVEKEFDKAVKLKAEDHKKFQSELSQKAGNYYAAAVIANYTKPRPEGEKAFLLIIENEILEIYPSKYHEKIRVSLKNIYKKNIEAISASMAKASNGEVSVDEIRRFNEYQKEQVFQEKQKEFRGFAKASLNKKK